MEHFNFYSIFDHYMYLAFDDVSEILGVKKICFKSKIEIYFICSKKQKEIVIETFEEIFTHLSPRILNNFYFGLRGKSIVNSDFLFVIFFLVKNI